MRDILHACSKVLSHATSKGLTMHSSLVLSNFFAHRARRIQNARNNGQLLQFSPTPRDATPQNTENSHGLAEKNREYENSGNL